MSSSGPRPDSERWAVEKIRSRASGDDLARPLALAARLFASLLDGARARAFGDSGGLGSPSRQGRRLFEAASEAIALCSETDPDFAWAACQLCRDAMAEAQPRDAGSFAEILSDAERSLLSLSLSSPLGPSPSRTL